MSLRATLLFHLNLQYSSIEEEDRAQVIERCYRPLLALLDQVPGLVLAVEASAATLEAAAAVDPGWVRALAAHAKAGRVELIGSGDTQLIGPLVPASVHRWNQRLGREGYERLLGLRPTTALIGEMAWSKGLVPAYLDEGYDCLVMEWNNPRATHPAWDNEWRYGLSWTPSGDGRRARLAWVDAVLFQKFQRAAHGDLEPEEVADWVIAQRPAASAPPRHVFLYASDAEVLDHRPGRYATEARLAAEGEWRRAARLCALLSERDVAFTTPGELARDPAFAPRGEVELGTARDPIPVKKQPKYNVTRWALSGRDDAGLNARCFAEARRLEQRGEADPAAWRRLCRLWSSDLRTHVTARRWSALAGALPEPAEPPRRRAGPALARADVARAGRHLSVDAGGVACTLNARRGLALERVHFAEAGALIGTLAHGAFDDIRYAADFYSGHTVLDVPGRQRVTDLSAVEPEVRRAADAVVVEARVPTPLGALEKRVEVAADRLRIELGLSALGARPLCSLRVGHVTLLPDAWGPDLAVTVAQGGAPERFALDGPCDHTRGVPPLCTASAAFGATDGRLVIDDGRVALEIAWDPAQAAALPLLVHLPVGKSRLVRVALSLAEVDDTFREGAPLADFALELRAWRIA